MSTVDLGLVRPPSTGSHYNYVMFGSNTSNSKVCSTQIPLLNASNLTITLTNVAIWGTSYITETCVVGGKNSEGFAIETTSTSASGKLCSVSYTTSVTV